VQHLVSIQELLNALELMNCSRSELRTVEPQFDKALNRCWDPLGLASHCWPSIARRVGGNSLAPSFWQSRAQSPRKGLKVVSPNWATKDGTVRGCCDMARIW
jgi:hypothetical protein